MMQTWRQGMESLERAGIGSARLDAQLLLAGMLGTTREAVLMQEECRAEGAQAAQYEAWIERRAGREPVAKILQRKGFWKQDFLTGPDTLDPRPDSETLIEAVLAGRSDRQTAWRILDLGTGTGCLLLSLLEEYPQAQGLGLDVSPAALAVAAENAARLGMNARVRWQETDWCVAHLESGSWDMIISNPPYIPSADIGGLMPEVAAFDPRLALDGGPDGLEAYRDIAVRAEEWLAPGGLLCLELGEGQEEAVAALFPSGWKKWVEKDLAGAARALLLEKQA